MDNTPKLANNVFIIMLGLAICTFALLLIDSVDSNPTAVLLYLVVILILVNLLLKQIQYHLLVSKTKHQWLIRTVSVLVIVVYLLTVVFFLLLFIAAVRQL